MTTRTNLNGEVNKSDCSEIGQGDYVRHNDGDVHIVTNSYPEHQEVEAINLNGGQRRFFDKSDSDDGVLIFEKLDRGSVTIDVGAKNNTPKSNSAIDAVRNFKPSL